MDFDKTIALPWYVIALYTVVFFSWMLYLAREEKKNNTDIALLKQSYHDIDEDIKSLRENINDRMDRQDHQIEKMQDKIDKIYDMLHSRRGK